MVYGTRKGKDREKDNEERAMAIPGGKAIPDHSVAGWSVVRHRLDPDPSVGRPARVAFLDPDHVVGGQGRGPVPLCPEGVRTAGGR